MNISKITLLLLLGVVLLLPACKDDQEDVRAGIVGSWVVRGVLAAEDNPDNLSLPGAGTMQFQACPNQADNRCPGRFSFDQQPEVPFGYSAFSSTDRNINILPDFSVQTSYYLTGSWEVLTLETNTLVIRGPLRIQRANDTFSTLNVRITLSR